MTYSHLLCYFHTHMLHAMYLSIAFLALLRNNFLSCHVFQLFCLKCIQPDGSGFDYSRLIQSFPYHLCDLLAHY